MGNYLKTYGIIRRKFHRPVSPLGTFGLLQARKVISSLGLALDNLIFPGFRRCEIRKPIFILGNPRSGTTFLHRLLERSETLCAFQLWEMIFPAITSRKVFSPFIDRLSPLSPARHHASEAHETTLRDLETDDLLEFLNFFDGGFLWSYFLAWEDEWGSGQCRSFLDPETLQRAGSDRLFTYLDRCWRRNMYYKDRDRVVVKSSMLTLRIEDLISRYPDCRILYCVRDPLETIPSGMSLLSGVLQRAYNAFNTADRDSRALYRENLYRASCHLYEAFHTARQKGLIPSDRLLIVPFPRLMKDLEGLFGELLDFVDVEHSEEYRKAISEQAEKQKSYTSGHTYSLEQFGLEEERIRRDLAFVYGEYNV